MPGASRGTDHWVLSLSLSLFDSLVLIYTRERGVVFPVGLSLYKLVGNLPERRTLANQFAYFGAHRVCGTDRWVLSLSLSSREREMLEYWNVTTSIIIEFDSLVTVVVVVWENSVCGIVFFNSRSLEYQNTYFLQLYDLKKWWQYVTTSANWGSIPQVLFETGVC